MAAVRLLAAVVLCALSLVAQERRAHPGKVVGADGKPVADADVVLLASVPFADALGNGDLVRGKSDAQGRFRVELLPGLDYRAFATAAGVASPTVAVEPGQQCELRLQPCSAKLSITGLAAWKELGPFRLRIWFAGAHGLWPDVAIEQDAAALPPLPFDRVELSVLDAKGEPLIAPQQVFGELQVPEPHRLTARVVDEHGKPLTGARIEQRTEVWGESGTPISTRAMDRRALRGITDAEGKATILVPFDQDPFEAGDSWQDLHFVASMDGRAPSLCGFTEGLYVDSRHATDEQKQKKELLFTLRPATPRTLRITAPPAAMPAHVVLLAETKINQKDNAWSSCNLQFALTVGADGRCTLPPLPAETTLTDVLVPALARPASEGAGSDPFQRCWSRQPLCVPLPAVADGAECAVALTDIGALRLQLAGADKTPAGGAWVFVLGRSENGYRIDTVQPLGRTDQLGRFGCTLPKGDWLLVAFDREGCALQKLEADATAGKPLQLEREPFAHMRIKVVDADGKPVAGARASMRQTSWSGGGDAIAEARTGLAHRLANWLLVLPTSGVDGMLDLRFLTSKSLRMRFMVRTDGSPGKPSRQSELVTLVDENEPTEVRIQ